MNRAKPAAKANSLFRANNSLFGSKKFPVNSFRENGKTSQKIQSLRPYESAICGPYLQDFPVFSLLNREFRGDGFARDSLHRQQVFDIAE
jgi:hypothetical protein